MKRPSWLYRIWLSYFAKPKDERIVYRDLLKRPASRIVEIGVVQGERAERLIRLAQKLAGGTVLYTGIDTFESTPPGRPFLKLKDAFKRLSVSGCKTNLVPGDPLSALTRVANNLAGTQLLLIDASIRDDSLQQAWFYVPRMLTDTSWVYRQRADGTYQRLSSPEIARLAAEAAAIKNRAA